MSRNLLLGTTIPLLFSSCAAVDTIKTSASTASKGLAQFSLSDLRPAGIDIVEAREADLKEMPLGKDRALAFDKKRKRTFWSAIKAPKTYKEPVLPDLPVIDDSEIDGSLLPPKPL